MINNEQQQVAKHLKHLNTQAYATEMSNSHSEAGIIKAISFYESEYNKYVHLYEVDHVISKELETLYEIISGLKDKLKKF